MKHYSASKTQSKSSNHQQKNLYKNTAVVLYEAQITNIKKIYQK